MFQALKEKMPQRKELLSNLWLLVKLITFIGVFSMVFGDDNTLIGVAIATGVLMFMEMDLGYRPLTAFWICVVVFLTMPVVTYLVSHSLYVGCILNMIYVYLLMMVTQRHIDDVNYLPFILGYVFICGTPVEIDQMGLRMLAAALGGVLIGLSAGIYSKKRNLKYVVCLRNLHFTKDRVQRVFAVKMAVGLGIAVLLGQIIGNEKAMWISVAVMSLTRPRYIQTKDRIPKRFFGTVIGCILFLVIFQLLVPQSFSFLAVAVLSYIYTFIKDYFMQMVLVTVNALVVAITIFDTPEAIITRLTFLLAGSLLAYLIGRFYYYRYGS